MDTDEEVLVMKKVIITYSNGRTVQFLTNEVLYKTEFGWLQEIGYLPEGKNRKKWFPIGGRRDANNDYTGTIVNIEEV